MSGELIELGTVDAPHREDIGRPLRDALAELTTLRGALEDERQRSAGLERALLALAEHLDAERGGDVPSLTTRVAGALAPTKGDRADAL